MKTALRKLSALHVSLASKLFLATSPHTTYGRKCYCGKFVEFRITDKGALTLGENVTIQRYSLIVAKAGEIRFGDNSSIGYGCIITSQDSIRIGENVLIAEHVTIRDQDHIFGKNKVTRESGINTAPIIIKDNVWIGAKVTILKGVTIGENSVIAANAVVTNNIPPNCLAGGIPATIIREID